MKHDIGKPLYLEGVVFYDKEPFYIKGVEEGEIYGIFLNGKRQVSRPINSEKWDFTSPRLGYMNRDGSSAGYIMRRPIRQWRQGLTSKNTYVFGRPGFPIFADILNLRKMLLNQYPTYEEAVHLAKEAGLVAFHRQFAVDRKLGIHYKGRKIGTMGVSGGIILSDAYSVMMTMCEKVIYETQRVA